MFGNQYRWEMASLVLGAVLISAQASAQQTVGPKGETATHAKTLELTDQDLATLKAGEYKAALLWHIWSDHTAAVNQGAKDELERLGITVTTTTNAQFDPSIQRGDVETSMTSSPDLMLTVPVDSVASAQAFGPAVDASVELVFLAAVPEGFEHEKDYVTLVTNDLFQMGERAADALAESIGEQGEIAYVFYDQTLYVPNQRDQAFKYTIENKYPNIDIVAEHGIVDPNRAGEIADAVILRNPDLDAIYVTWAQPAEAFLASLRTAGNTDIKLVTIDLSEPLALDMIAGGNTIAIVADEAYNYGIAAARAGALGLLDKPVPPFIIVDALTITANNVRQGWNQSLHKEPPERILDALAKR